MTIFKGHRGKKYIEYLLLIIIAILFYKLADVIKAENIKAILGYASPIIGGVVIAFLLHIPALKIEKLFKKSKGFFNKHARGFSVFLTYLIALALITLLLYAILPVIFKNLIELIENLPEYSKTVISTLNQYADAEGMIYGVNVEELLNIIPQKIVSFFDVEKVGAILNGVYSVGSTIVSLGLSVIISVYIMLDRDQLIHTCGKVCGIFVRGKTVSAFHEYLKRICAIFYSYVYSQLLDAFIVSVIFIIAFYIIGVPYAFFFGFLVGICNLIPYFGAIIGGAIVSIVTLITNGFTTAIITAVVILVLQQIDANILQPKIVGETVGIRPIYVLAAITIGGGLFGFIGILISVPLMASLRMILVDLVEYTSKRRRAERLVLVKKEKREPEPKEE